VLLFAAIARWPHPGSALVLSTEERDPGDDAMSRYADGDDRAFSEVYRAVASRLRAFLARLVRSEPLADDLFQETLLRMHRARGSFARGARLLPWCYAIARNVHVDHLRHRPSQRERPAETDEPIELAAGPEVDGEALAAAAQLAARVEATLAKLPPNQREAFILIRYEGLSVADAAAVLGTTEGAVKLRAFHAYEALREALGTEKKKPKPKRGEA
jgi:RNA polymerase sigma-70 factor (ECF subfamily)